MKRYTYLSFVETAQALEDGKYVEWADTSPTPTKLKWRRKTSKNVNANFRYRLIEEVEEWAAEIGASVLVKTKDGDYKDYGCNFKGMFEGKFLCEDSSGMLIGWDEIAPIKKETKQLHGGLKEWKAKVGELVQVKHKDDSEFRPDAREYRGVVDGKYFCRLNSWARLIPWDEIAPVTEAKELTNFVNGCFSGIEEKRKPRVHWSNEYPNGDIVGNHMTSDTALAFAAHDCIGQVKFVEEIKE